MAGPARLHRPRASLLRAPVKRVNVSRFSTSSRRQSYADTLPNLRIGAHTRVLFQGFTGRRHHALLTCVVSMAGLTLRRETGIRYLE
jgi:hypothetical protein